VKCCCLILLPFPERKSVSVSCFILLICVHFKCEWKHFARENIWSCQETVTGERWKAL
jgi:hypothetical protein